MSVRSLARKLGLSATAVSLALKDSPRVSADVRMKVQKLAKDSGYVPNARLAELMDEVRRSVSPSYRSTLAAFSLYPEEEPWRTRPYLRVVLQSATERAQSHGYRLEYFWLKRPGMTPARFRSILETRGIQGIFCLGSLNPEEKFPEELRKFAVITFAASIPTRLHRVVSHFEADARLLFEQLLRRGYKRPGLAMLVHGDRRTDYAYSACYLSAQERLFAPSHLPILRSDEWDEIGFENWFDTHRPDVIVMHQAEDYIAGVERWLKSRRMVVPRDVGLALLDKNPHPARYAGICQDPARMGATAAEMLIGRVLLRDLSPPEHPKVELVVGDWNEGRTLRSARPVSKLISSRKRVPR
jgi:LacI family transcriptional regulator